MYFEDVSIGTRLHNSAFFLVVVFCNDQSPSVAKRSVFDKGLGLHLPVGIRINI